MVSENDHGAPKPRTRSPGESVPAGRSLEDRIAELKRIRGDVVPVDDIDSVVRSILGTMTGDLSGQDLRIYNEIEDLSRYIRAAKTDIAALNPADIREEFLPTATDELDAIIESTEAATGAIMDAAEVLDQMHADLSPEAAEQLQRQTTLIYEACSFQDITGQRISKIVRMLKNIEDRVEGLVGAFGSIAPSPQERAQSPAIDPNADLLNGPQLEGQGMKQGDVDDILAKFD